MSTPATVHRSILRWTLTSAVGGAVIAAAIVLTSTSDGASQGLRVGLALIGSATAFVFFLVATRGRILLSLACSALPIFSCLGMAQGPGEADVAWFAAAIGVLTVALATVLAVWVSNRWGKPSRTGLSDALANWT